MKKNEIRLSPKHGVNPAVPVCFFCGQDKNEVILAGRLRDDAEAPRKAVWDKQPCDTCAEYMRQGVILISVREGSDGENPYRTGGFAVVKAEAIERIVQPPELRAKILEARVAFIPDDAWLALGMPDPTAAAS